MFILSVPRTRSISRGEFTFFDLFGAFLGEKRKGGFNGRVGSKEGRTRRRRRKRGDGNLVLQFPGGDGWME